jgi:signal transduction histidine kinase
MAPRPDQLGARESLQDLLCRLDSAERQISELRDYLDHAQRLSTLGTLTTLVAHELNNLLTPTVAYCQMALSSPQDQHLAIKALRKAELAAAKATEVAQAILDFSRPNPTQSGGHDRGLQTAKVTTAIESALACLSRDLSKDGITLNLAVHPEDKVQIRPVALQQVFLNLILNARQAMIPRGGTLSFHTEPLTGSICPPLKAVAAGCLNILEERSDHRPRVQIRVSDTGAGMPPEIMNRLFVPFTRQSTDGSGLGLVVCLKLIQDAGGAILVESEPNRGTTFTICLYSVV